ncbi:uncharacterized protein ATNIH1004_005491 [Aspergillus tanneri]|uniref:Uncharacterized protein n=1 Tax=Aspergillus tanneri TaxID=1220188 RepID=A0A5M9MLN2_9EURO|nr:uncharacterized protein ATNIH1004_005491 [Aspergillus tanneri]KAA8646816.1 hypothetical protein ATNIH1004_005491 [Aspergillus tanneri]
MVSQTPPRRGNRCRRRRARRRTAGSRHRAPIQNSGSLAAATSQNDGPGLFVPVDSGCSRTRVATLSKCMCSNSRSSWASSPSATCDICRKNDLSEHASYMEMV